MIFKALFTATVFLGNFIPQEPKPPTQHIQAPLWAKCPQYWSLALKVGWRKQDLPTLDKIMFRESRCERTAVNADDPSGGSRGLLQINGFWTPWLKERGILSAPRASQGLFDPATNLLSGLHIYNYADSRYGNGWGPWGL